MGIPGEPAPMHIPERRRMRSSDALEAFGRILEDIAHQLALRPLLTSITRHACELLRADDGAIGLYQQTRKVIRVEAIHRLPQIELNTEFAAGRGLMGRILETREPVVLDRYGDLEGMTVPELADNAVIGVPIFGGTGQLIGAFGIGAQPPRRFEASDVAMLQLFARHAAIAIQNAVRYEREQRRSERMALIAQVSRLVSSELEPEELVATTADIIHTVLGYPNVVIPLIEHDDDGEYLVFRSHAGAYAQIFTKPYRMRVSLGIIGAAITQRASQMVNDVSRDPRYVPPPEPIDVSAELAVPIVLGDEVYGCVNVEGLEPFDEDDVRSIEIIADHLAVAIKNNRLWTEARHAAVMRERQRLARDLHDSVSQALSSISMTAQSLVSAWQRDPAEGERRTHRLEELSRLAFAEMRALLRELRPATGLAGSTAVKAGVDDVKAFGLQVALRKLAAILAPETPSIRLDFSDYHSQPREVEEELYMICREALSNAIRHSKARVVRVHASRSVERINIVVSDDGSGFDPLEQQAGADSPDHGIGLLTMHERARALGGSCHVASRVGLGSAVDISVPYSPTERDAP
ncbi:GAF domain-containing sensor histidine kinase [Povalibacter sp.]|uniref:GAF domain-containing sensor histidine kinase n=1 Tax=Povalibacter sp. TaxID=1962978 RepID=UPI002F4191F4